MKTSSFLSGILVGAAATAMLTRNKGSIMSSSAMHNAKDKMMDFASLTMGGSGAAASNHYTSSGVDHAYSRQDSINQVKDFIRSNPEVKHEVDSILKETNTFIPGL